MKHLTAASDRPDDAGDRSIRADVAGLMEDVRLAEGQLERRRQRGCGLSLTMREALRLVAEAADASAPLTPTELAKALEVTTPSVSSMLSRLTKHGLVATVPRAQDRRSKVVVPTDRHLDVDAVAPLNRALRDLAAGLSEADAAAVGSFLASARGLIDAECR